MPVGLLGELSISSLLRGVSAAPGVAFGQAVVLEAALAALALVVVLDVEHALKVGVEPSDLAHCFRCELP